MKKCLIFLLLILYSVAGFAINNIKVLGLFPDKALVVIDGEEYLLAVGQKSPEGVTLLSIENDDAWLLVDGNRVAFDIDPADDYQVAHANTVTVAIEPDERGLYLLNGYINDRWVTFLVDTGSSHTAISEKQAKELGLNYEKEGVMVQIDTASGRGPAHAMRLNEVKIGDIKLHNVAALIIPGELPATPLLGMSFLEKLKIHNEGNILYLTQPRTNDQPKK